MRESFKKAKVMALWLLQPIQKSLRSILWSRGWGEDYLGQLSLLASQALEYYVLFFTTWNNFSRPVFLTVLKNITSVNSFVYRPK